MPETPADLRWRVVRFEWPLLNGPNLRETRFLGLTSCFQTSVFLHSKSLQKLVVKKKRHGIHLFIVYVGVVVRLLGVTWDCPGWILKVSVMCSVAEIGWASLSS